MKSTGKIGTDSTQYRKMHLPLCYMNGFIPLKNPVVFHRNRDGNHPHLVVYEDDSVNAIVPLYVKSHSFGEFVFDFMFADLADQLNIDYYPKLVGVIPATPSPGYRFLSNISHTTNSPVFDFIFAEIDSFCKKNGIHSFSILYPDTKQRSQLDSGFISWEHQNYTWINPGFTTFDDYLLSFTKNQRRNIRRERASIEKENITVKAVTGDVVPGYWHKIMFKYYLNTNNQFGPWAARYLNGTFFTMCGEYYRDNLLYIAAFENSGKDPVALSFLAYDENSIIGRYWGSEKYYPNLHFELCYYKPIEWAIEKGIKIFDPGIGSPHKVRRGFKAVINPSYHKYFNYELHDIVKYNMPRFNSHEQATVESLNRSSPLKDS
jgi:predicted N-acyltransferase